MGERGLRRIKDDDFSSQAKIFLSKYMLLSG